MPESLLKYHCKKTQNRRRTIKTCPLLTTLLHTSQLQKKQIHPKSSTIGIIEGVLILEGKLLTL
jgi:hypothetical protein